MKIPKEAYLSDDELDAIDAKLAYSEATLIPGRGSYEAALARKCADTSVEHAAPIIEQAVLRGEVVTALEEALTNYLAQHHHDGHRQGCFPCDRAATALAKIRAARGE